MKVRNSGSGAAHVSMFGRPTIFMNKAGEGGGGGGSGGEGGEGGDDDEAKFGTMFNKFFHKAMGERDKRSESKLAKTLEAFQAKMLEEVGKVFETHKGENKEKEGEGGDKKKEELSPELRAQIKRAEDAAKEAKEKADKWEREAKAASEKQRKTEERNMLVSSLNGKVKPALLEMVVDQLHGRHIVRDEDSDKILWKTADGEFLPIKDGLDSWAKSDFAKEVAPPVQARGSGGRGGDGGHDTKGPMTMEGLGAIIAGTIPGAR